MSTHTCQVSDGGRLVSQSGGGASRSELHQTEGQTKHPRKLLRVGDTKTPANEDKNQTKSGAPLFSIMRFDLIAISSSILFAAASDDAAAWRHSTRTKEHHQTDEEESQATRRIVNTLLHRDGIQKPLFQNRRRRLAFQRHYGSTGKNEFEELRNYHEERREEDTRHHPIRTTCDPSAPSDFGILQCGEGYTCALTDERKTVIGGGGGICLPTTSIRSGAPAARGMLESSYCQDTAEEVKMYGLDYDGVFPDDCDFTNFNPDDASGHITCLDRVHCDDRGSCYEASYFLDCDQRPARYFICESLLCTTEERVCADRLLIGYEDSYGADVSPAAEIIAEVNGNACTVTREGGCRWADCPDFRAPYLLVSCGVVIEYNFPFPFHENSCFNPFSISGVTGMPTCSEDTLTAGNDMLTRQNTGGFCGFPSIGQQQSSNDDVGGGGGDGGDGIQGGGDNGGNDGGNDGNTQQQNGVANPKEEEKYNKGPIIESAASTVSADAIFSLLLAGLVAKLLANW